MQIILLNNGEGVARAETVHLKSGKIQFEFVGAPAYSVITALSDTRTIRRNLVDKNVCEFDVSEMLGDFTFTVSAREKVWYCDGIRIEQTDDGNVKVCSLTNYADHFKSLSAENEKLSKEVAELKSSLHALRDEFEHANKDYHII